MGDNITTVAGSGYKAGAYTDRGSLSALENINHGKYFHILYEILRTSKIDIQKSLNQKYKSYPSGTLKYEVRK